MVLFLCPGNYFAFLILYNLSVKDIGHVPHEAHIAREIDIQALFACESKALLSLLFYHNHHFHVYFRGSA